MKMNTTDVLTTERASALINPKEMNFKLSNITSWMLGKIAQSVFFITLPVIFLAMFAIHKVLRVEEMARNYENMYYGN